MNKNDYTTGINPQELNYPSYQLTGDIAIILGYDKDNLNETQEEEIKRIIKEIQDTGNDIFSRQETPKNQQIARNNNADKPINQWKINSSNVVDPELRDIRTNEENIDLNNPEQIIQNLDIGSDFRQEPMFPGKDEISQWLNRFVSPRDLTYGEIITKIEDEKPNLIISERPSTIKLSSKAEKKLNILNPLKQGLINNFLNNETKAELDQIFGELIKDSDRYQNLPGTALLVNENGELARDEGGKILFYNKYSETGKENKEEFENFIQKNPGYKLISISRGTVGRRQNTLDFSKEKYSISASNGFSDKFNVENLLTNDETVTLKVKNHEESFIENKDKEITLNERFTEVYDIFVS